MAVQIPALGRVFNLGTLYDCRNDAIIPGISLWDLKTLQSSVQSSKNTHSNYTVITEDTFEKKSFHLDIDANLKLSFLCDLLTIEGAGKYLYDRKSSQHQARVTLQYKSTTSSEALTMNHLDFKSIQFPDVMDDDHATHVVTQVDYGADAFLVFDRLVRESENLQEVHGNMEAIIQKLSSSLKLKDASLDLENFDKLDTKTLQCTFHGDFQLSSNPSTFEEAVQIYNNLPKLMQSVNGGKGVPKKVYLYPISKLGKKPLKMIRQITNSLISQIEQRMEFFHEMEVKIKDLQRHEVNFKFAHIEYQLSTFSSLITQFKTDIVAKMAQLLPRIRGEGAEEKELAEIISHINESAFSPEHVEKFLKGKKKEVQVLAQHLTNIRNETADKCIFTGGACEKSLEAVTSNFQYSHYVCFAFNITNKIPSYIECLKKYLSEGNIMPASSVCDKEWFQRDDKGKLDQKLKCYLKLAKSNLMKNDIAFVINCDERSSENLEGPQIILHNKDSVVSVFEPPSSPGELEVKDVTHNSVSLAWAKPESGAADTFQVVCSTTGTSLGTTTSSIEVDGTEATIEHLSPNTEYHFTVMAVTELGILSAGITCIVTTKLCPFVYDLLKEPKLLREGKPSVYELPPIIKNKENKPEKVLILIGAKNAETSSLIYGIANYILGVKWKDDYRFQAVNYAKNIQGQAKGETYTFYSPEFPYALTIYNIPFNEYDNVPSNKFDSNKYDEYCKEKGNIMIQIDVLLTGIDQIHGLGFVVRASNNKLTPTQYIFDRVCDISNIREMAESNIFLLVTSADANPPPVVENIKVPYKESFKFSTSAIFARNKCDPPNSEFNFAFWRMGYKSIECFLQHFSEAPAQSLTSTKEVEQKRLSLVLIPELERHVKKEYLMDNDKGDDTTYCYRCKYACHYNCPYSSKEDKWKCYAMRCGHCIACPNKCSWNLHGNAKYSCGRSYSWSWFNYGQCQYTDLCSTLKEVQNCLKIFLKHELQSEITKKICDLDGSIQYVICRSSYEELCAQVKGVVKKNLDDVIKMLKGHEQFMTTQRPHKILHS